MIWHSTEAPQRHREHGETQAIAFRSVALWRPRLEQPLPPASRALRDWNQSGNIKDIVGKLNRVRKENSALRHLDNIIFVPTENENIIAYVKMTPDRSNILLAAVNLDPHHAQEATLQLPMDKLGFSWAYPAAWWWRPGVCRGWLVKFP